MSVTVDSEEPSMLRRRFHAWVAVYLARRRRAKTWRVQGNTSTSVVTVRVPRR